MNTDFAIIGGGVVGLSLAWGLLKQGYKVTIVDGSDGSYRASRGNFGLIWVQGKGVGAPHYARWTQRSASLYRDFSEELSDATGINVSLEQNGGFEYFFSDDDLLQTQAVYEQLKQQLGGDYPFEILRGDALRKEEPTVGPEVTSAILHHQDGHLNPLKLLRALNADCQRMGGVYLSNHMVRSVSKGHQFTLSCDDGTRIGADRVILSAGLGALDLGPKMGFVTPLEPERGQVLITEKLPRMINRPSVTARQVDEGGIQIGATNEKIGFNRDVTTKGIAFLADQAIRTHPFLAKVKLVRSWGALRILSRDGKPIYQESPTMPGAYLVTCHSGITLAAVHARLLPGWFDKKQDAPDLEAFSEDRFRLS
ncbi:FAD-dependent oxidoreductase [uncultured Cohaesibacter sp.]|uniref:NAD(P)/FAD-dependent oxidoreductase n=1 Tax=uncultured Cohaesibacter sp. TaxID=1002546 RepID=UPI00292F487C|nr:FAD-dependent oxidoreductase [uncultured Cohaesibacter sp.]